jgi:uncharacterized membrane protein YqaE (UPF0057 family)
MKSNTLFTIFSTAAVLATVFLQGCATSNDVVSDRGIQKRKYRSGYYVSNRSSETNSGARKGEAAFVPAPAPTALVSTPTPPAPNAPELVARQAGSESSRAEFTAPQPSILATEQPSNRPLNVVQVSDAIQVVAHPAVQAENQSTALAIDVNGDESKDDVEFLIILILCFLLPPLAIYLLQGINFNFWVSIVLTILFWIPGVLFALYHTLKAF